MGAVMVDDPSASPASRKELLIDLLYLDMEKCTRCQGTDANLEAALEQVKRILEAAGVAVTVRRTLIESAEQARRLGFVSSPTIRVNGQDIALELRESNCADCGEVSGCHGAIDCRVWIWQGQEYTQAPPAMIVDAILRAVYGGGSLAPASAPMAAVPENVERFLAGKKRLAAEAASCCSPTEQAASGELSQKASSCGEAPTPESCGCQ